MILCLKTICAMVIFWIKGFEGMKILPFLMGVIVLAGCDMNQKTYVSPNRAQIEKTRYDTEVSVGMMDDNFYKALASEYKSNGGAGLNLTFVYNPASGNAAGLSASELAGNAARKLRGYGADDVSADILPVADSAHSGKVLVSYTKFAALAPKDCETMPGLDDNQIELSWDYKYGCSVEERLAKQLARPSDLLGNDAAPETSSGRRATNLSAPHELGVANEPLDGDSITDVGD